jgi:hypothetical protein
VQYFLAMRVALTATANEDHRPSFEAHPSRFLFCERARTPSPIGLLADYSGIQL